MSLPTSLPSWRKLEEHHAQIRSLHLRDLFREDPERAERFSVSLEDIVFDYSKNRITNQTLDLLLQLAREAELPRWIEKMFAGEKINVSERRAVLHIALRKPRGSSVFVDGKDVMPEVHAVLDRMREFSESVRTGRWHGYTGRPIQDVVNIGIGGSDLGPMMVTRALRPYHSSLRLHFVSNIDGTHLVETLRGLDPETTLFLVSSKSFGTLETLTNARSARAWFLDKAKDPAAVAKHFVAISTNEKAVVAFGIDKKNMFPFWDWVGGRYSLWSAIGLSIVLAIGMDRFEELLAGAHAADEHFRTAPLEKNIPVLMGLLGIWYNNFFQASTHAVFPYDQYLEFLPAYLQQADMESNGKHVQKDGTPVAVTTGPILWGAPGTNGQHAFFQLLHQGTKLVPADFLVPAQSHNPLGPSDEHHRMLLANCLAQTEALLRGRTAEEVRAEMEAAGLAAEDIARLTPHRVCEGNRPSNTFLFRKLTPRTLGSLIALYEHKIFVQGTIWNIDSFDQWGVELGKQLAQNLLPEISGEPARKPHDSSTERLLRLVRGWL
ncbi:Glucose-6-phosphate isomerase [Methylacidimicrobium sp. AP8]|uniref:glucose-6-phosphate isomerase n=1 Tax=Methylacidimicrobium sp. AP8 TaxID=2730359 RepID=UPI0018C02FC5|nr:glucose-6-phosphate isomerase [Methylacidimicrobium sp. AP8]CAB4244061.1 Glucose-6-phosphate isomerase [Methylacidimicrobium sp. AP8]